MKKFKLLNIVLICTLVNAYAQTPNYTNWEKVFEDHFDNGFDTSNWKKEEGAHCWSEYQIQWTTINENNVYISNNNLILKAKKESITASNWACSTPTQYDYTSGWVTSHKKFQYGYYEIRCKLPQGNGLWPAFWLYGQGGDLEDPAPGQAWKEEIDIFEAYGRPNDVEYNYHDEHWDENLLRWSQESVIGNAELIGVNNVSNWHTYGVDWSENKLDFYIDGNLKYTAPYHDRVAEHPMTIIMNLGIKPGTTLNEATYEIDYVRVYKKKLILDNNILNYPASYNYEAIYSAEIAPNYNYVISGDGEKGGKLSIMARESIKLNQGFKIEKGGYFSSKIGKLDYTPTKKSGLISSNDSQNEITVEEDDYQINNKSEINIYPNPTTDMLKIEINESEIYSYNILSINGRVIKSQKYVSGVSMINLNDQQNGIYFIELKRGDEIIRKKIVKL